jgi:hypothetical protein
MGAGLYATYAAAHRALLVLYGWDTTEWDRQARADTQSMTDALARERQKS